MFKPGAELRAEILPREREILVYSCVHGLCKPNKFQDGILSLINGKEKQNRSGGSINLDIGANRMSGVSSIIMSWIHYKVVEEKLVCVVVAPTQDAAEVMATKIKCPQFETHMKKHTRTKINYNNESKIVFCSAASKDINYIINADIVYIVQSLRINDKAYKRINDLIDRNNPSYIITENTFGG